MECCSASGNFCCMRLTPDWRCWRWERSVSWSSIAIFRGGAGVRLWTRWGGLESSGAKAPRGMNPAFPRRMNPALLCLLVLATVSAHAAGPVDFGKAELDAALAERNLKLHVDTELSLNPPETFSITLYKTG